MRNWGFRKHTIFPIFPSLLNFRLVLFKTYENEYPVEIKSEQNWRRGCKNLKLKNLNSEKKINLNFILF